MSSIQTRTNVYAYVSEDNANTVMNRIRAALEEHDLFITEETEALEVGLIQFYCEDFGQDPQDYINVLSPIATEYGIDINISYESDLSDVETDQFFVGPHAIQLAAKEQLTGIKEAITLLLRTYDPALIAEVAEIEGFNPASLATLLVPKMLPTHDANTASNNLPSTVS